MASIDVQANGKYRVRYRDPAGKSRSKSFRLKRDAQAFKVGIEGSLHNGLFVDPALGRRLFGDWAEQWLTNHPRRPQTLERYDSMYRNHIAPTFANRSLAGITRDDIMAWVTRLRKAGLAPRYIELAYTVLRAMFKEAVLSKHIPHSPCLSVKLPEPAAPQQLVPLVDEEVWAIHDAVPERYRTMILTAAFAGLRQGELLALRVADLALPFEPAISVARQAVEVTHQPVDTSARLKTDASYRTVPINLELRDVLVEHVARYELAPGDLLWTAERGGALRRNRVSEIISAALKTAEMPAGITLHDLRHFYASLLIREGANFRVVQARMGHSKASETLDTYAHLWPVDESETRRMVARAWRR